MGLAQCLRQSLEEKIEQCRKDMGWEKESCQSLVFDISLVSEPEAMARMAHMLESNHRLVVAEPCDAQRTIDIPGALLDKGLFLTAQAGAPGGCHVLEFIKKGGLPGFLQRFAARPFPGRLVVRSQRRALRGGAMIVFLELEPQH